MTLRIAVPRGEPKPGFRDRRTELYSDVLEVVDSLGEADRARVGLLFGDGDRLGPQRITELVEHHITAKTKVAAVDDEGNSVRIQAAVNAIMGKMLEHEDELRANVTPPP